MVAQYDTRGVIQPTSEAKGVPVPGIGPVRLRWFAAAGLALSGAVYLASGDEFSDIDRSFMVTDDTAIGYENGKLVTFQTDRESCDESDVCEDLAALRDRMDIDNLAVFHTAIDAYLKYRNEARRINGGTLKHEIYGDLHADLDHTRYGDIGTLYKALDEAMTIIGDKSHKNYDAYHEAYRQLLTARNSLGSLKKDALDHQRLLEADIHEQMGQAIQRGLQHRPQ